MKKDNEPNAQDGGVLEQLSDGLARAVETAGQGTVRVDARRRLGATGVAWSADGLIVTADHVIEREEDILVGLPDGSEAAARLIGRDANTDLALLKVDVALATPDKLDGSGPRVGHIVLALGRPFNGPVSATLGIVSAVGGPWRSRHGGLVEGVVRSDVTMYPGFSGGPLVSTEGKIAGINTSMLGQVMSVALPAPVVDRVAKALFEKGRVRQGYLGVRTQQVELPAALAGQLGQQAGLMVIGVEAAGPADRAGVMLGDVVIGLGEQRTEEFDDLQSQLGEDRIGTAVPMRVVRGGERRELSVTVGERK